MPTTPAWFVVGLDKSKVDIVIRAAIVMGQTFRRRRCPKPAFQVETFDIVFAIDVMYHRDVEPTKMLQAIFSVLKPGGIVVLNNPAYEWLRSYHDVFVHAARRYTAKGVTDRTPPGGIYHRPLHLLEHGFVSAHGA